MTIALDPRLRGGDDAVVDQPQISVLLGVERSVCGRRWRARAADGGAAAAIAERLGLPEIVARLLAQRGIGVAEAPGFLRPRLREVLPDPAHLRDMMPAVDRLVRAIRDGERVVVFGDYDVDGATSAALLLRFLAAVGGHASVYVPDRLREGYGPNAPALLRLKAEGAGVVVTVDCGATAHDALAAAADAGLDVIVVDHHVSEPLLPRALALINPNRLDGRLLVARLPRSGSPFSWSSRSTGRCARPGGMAGGPSLTCCSGSISSPSVRCAMSCP